MSVEPHCGQPTACRGAPSTSGTGPGLRRGAAPGGEMPCSRSLRRPRAVIRSVDHGGSRTVRISTFSKPARRSRAATSARISAIAGHPE